MFKRTRLKPWQAFSIFVGSFLLSCSGLTFFSDSRLFAQDSSPTTVSESNTFIDKFIDKNTLSLLIFSFGILVIVLFVFHYLSEQAKRQKETQKEIRKEIRQYPTLKHLMAAKDSNFEARRLNFAGIVLFGLAIIFLQAMAMHFWGGESAAGKEIFDACKTIIPPLVSLVIGYYFGKSENQSEGEIDAGKGNEDNGEGDQGNGEGDQGNGEGDRGNGEGRIAPVDPLG